ncbi:predicted protein [Streptomyces iranensis]|uniref:Uncharacterized protein n=1 Tax=Streptomyces iranensis TaxID=576784 RepID=A0A060ZYK0_9ACTN|nr:predicted protein [Streptomyces iranensis]
MSGSVGAVCVVEPLVFGQDMAGVSFVEDEYVVEGFSAEGADHSFAVGVGFRRADRRLDDLDVLGLEYGVEGVGVLAVAVSDEEAQ